MSEHNTQQQVCTCKNGVQLSEQENAAIAAALYLYFYDNHDKENHRITIKDICNSPWNAKIYGINNLHR
ncbi:MAG: hypothetical protein LBM68_02020 [Bacteroidales bacterium]|jgi:hypothetical protein|nr:hypothetical protein [Bacteroidales bacterium]